MVDSQLIQYGIIWWYRTQKGNPRSNTSLTKNVSWLSKVEKKWASDQKWYNWLENTRKGPLIEHIPQKLEACIMLPAGCPSCLTTLKGVWVKNTTDCLGWERRLLDRENCYKRKHFLTLWISWDRKKFIIKTSCSIISHYYSLSFILPSWYST